MIEVIPGILEKTFDEIQKKIDLVVGLVDWVEIDILDNTLYKNVTYNSDWTKFSQNVQRVNLAAHLMVSDPVKYVEPLVHNGFTRLIADIEGYAIRDFITSCRMHGIELGVALNGPSELGLVEPFLDQVDTVLIMTINSGASGTPFLPEVLPKIRKIHEEYKELPIEVDGGISKDTAPLVIQNGATRLVSTSYLYWKNPDRITDAIEELRISG